MSSSAPTSTDDTTSPWSLYPYNANKPLPIIFAIIVFGLGVYHAIQCFLRYKWPRFGGMMVWATSVWLTGFICRAVSVYNTQNIPVYICQYVLILAGPPIYAAAETFILGRLFAYLPYHAPIHPGRVLSTFLILGIVVEVLAANGSSRLAGNGTASDRDTGIKLVQASVMLQAILEIFFSSLVAYLQYKCTRPGSFFPHNVKVMCYVLYITSSMMFVRCIVRFVGALELGNCGPATSALPTGNCGPVESQEWYLWVFEVANIALFVLLLAIFTPGKYLSSDDKVFLDQRDGVTERQGPGFAKLDRRSIILTILDPFNLRAKLRGERSIEPFWEQQWPEAHTNFEMRKGRMAGREDVGHRKDMGHGEQLTV